MVTARRIGAIVAAVLCTGAYAAPAAAAPAVTTAVTTVTGLVQDVVEERPGDTSDAELTHRVLRVGERTVPLVDGSLADVAAGRTVRASLADAAGGEKRVVAAEELATAAAAPDITGVHDVYVAMVRPVGTAGTDAYGVQDVTDTLATASAYWSDQTGGQVSFRVAGSVDWYDSEYACDGDTDSTVAIWEEALTRLDVPADAHSHLMVLAPQGADESLNCYYGYGSLGIWDDTHPAMTFVSNLNQSLLAHELGHNLGLHHANALHCAVTDPGFTTEGDDVVWPDECVRQEYGDLFDVMGFSGESYGEGNLNAAHLDGLGLLPTAVQTVGTGTEQDVRIARLSAAATAVRAAKIVDDWGNRYWVEYRTATGRDAITAADNPQEPSLGVRILKDDPAQKVYGASFVLDATPTPYDTDQQNSLAVGTSFTSENGLVTVTVASVDADGANLSITNRPVADASAVPAAVALNVPAGALAATATVTDAEGDPVADWNVQVQYADDADPDGGFGDVRTARTGTDGIASFTLPPAAYAGAYRAVTYAEGDAASVRSESVAVAASDAPADVSLTGLPIAATVGTRLTATATVRTGRQSPVVGWKVQLQRRLYGTPVFATVATATTGSAGTVSVPVTSGIGAAYRFVTLAGTDAPAVVSDVVDVAARGAVGLRRPAATARRGRALTVGGTVSAVPGAVVYVQARYGSGAWSQARAKVSGTAVSGSVTFSRSGTWQVRFSLMAGSGGRWSGQYSTTYPVRVS